MDRAVSRRLAIVGLSAAAAGWLAWRAARAPSSARSPAAPSGTDTDDAASAIAQALRRRHPDGTGGGHAVPDGSAVAYVHVVAAGDHWVYVTSGRYRAAAPHELVMRVFGEAAPGDPDAWKRAPLWPVRVLTEIANVEARTHRDFGDREDLTNLRLPEDPQPPYRHFAFTIPDRDIPDAIGPASAIRFVRVVPLTDAQKDDLYATGKLGVLADWYDKDPLMRVR